jgi:MFS family permease
MTQVKSESNGVSLHPGSPRRLPLLHRLLPRVYYGWPIAVASSLQSFVVVGVGFYGMAVFLDALCTERGWPRTLVSFATTLYFVTTGIAGTAIGRSVDRRGARGWIAAGALVMALSLVAIGRVDAPGQLVWLYPIFALGFSMCGPVPMGAITTRWFVTRRAFAMSIATTGVSVGGVVLVPLTTRLILERGLAETTTILAALLLVIVWPVVAFVLRWDPREHGLEPDGGAPPEHPSHAALLAAQDRVWSSREVLRAPAFWTLVVAFGAILFCQVATAMHQLALLRVHMDAQAAAFAVSTTAFGSIVARLVVGSFADRVSKRRLGVVLILIQASALSVFALASAVPLLYLASLVFGFTIGNLFMLQALLVGDLFGMRSFGKVMGLLQLLTQTASGLGPWVLGLLHAAFGSYPPGLAVLAGVAVASAAVLSQVRPPLPPGGAT